MSAVIMGRMHKFSDSILSFLDDQVEQGETFAVDVAVPEQPE